MRGKRRFLIVVLAAAVVAGGTLLPAGGDDREEKLKGTDANIRDHAWNALVAHLEMGGSGTFWALRLNDDSRFPIAAKAGFGNRRPETDLITGKLAALQMYQLAIPAPSGERAHFDFNARRGAELFNGKARCSNCPCSAPLHGTCLEYAHSGKRLESMHSRLSGHPTGATGRHRSEESPREKKELIIMTAVFARCATSLSITTAI
jgi:hypothetical protein